MSITCDLAQPGIHLTGLCVSQKDDTLHFVPYVQEEWLPLFRTKEVVKGVLRALLAASAISAGQRKASRGSNQVFDRTGLKIFQIEVNCKTAGDPGLAERDPSLACRGLGGRNR